MNHNLHDVTIVDMGDIPEESVSLPELSALREQWPPAVFRHMVWLQHDLEFMQADAKKRFRRHVSTCRKVSLGHVSVVAVPSIMVYGLEGQPTGLYGSC